MCAMGNSIGVLDVCGVRGREARTAGAGGRRISARRRGLGGIRCGGGGCNRRAAVVATLVVYPSMAMTTNGAVAAHAVPQK